MGGDERTALRAVAARGAVLVPAVLAASSALLLYAHLGTSAAVQANAGQLGARGLAAGAERCLGEGDVRLYKDMGVGALADMLLSCALSRSAQDCPDLESCVARCVSEEHGFSAQCSPCFAALSTCAAEQCLKSSPVCVDRTSAACVSCFGESCAPSFEACSGLGMPLDALWTAHDAATTARSPGAASQGGESAAGGAGGDRCDGLQDLFEVQFVDAVRQAWHGGAPALAVLLGVASGLWPYAKNALLLAVWTRRMEAERRDRLLKWLAWLGRWSFADVFVMILLNATLHVDKSLSSRRALVVLATPRSGIFAFCAAVVLSLGLGEWMRVTAGELRAAQAREGRQSYPALTNGRLRSDWRQALAENLRQNRLLDRRASLLVRLLLPALALAALVQGFFGLDLLEVSLTGPVAALPGQNTIRFTADGMLRGLLAPPLCAAASPSPAGQLLLAGFLFLTVLNLPAAVYAGTALLWALRTHSPEIEAALGRWWTSSRSPRGYSAPGSLQRLQNTLELCSTFASLDVFLVSLLLVTVEADKLVRAVSEAAVGGGVAFGVEPRLSVGAYVLAAAALMQVALQLLREPDAGRCEYRALRSRDDEDDEAAAGFADEDLEGVDLAGIVGSA